MSMGLLAALASGGDLPPEDPHLWLEDVEGAEALAWVRERNARTVAALTERPGFEGHRARLLAILDSDERIPYVTKRGPHWVNFWKDAAHPRGLWRRTTLESWRTDQPEWDVILDLDALAASEGEPWVWGGSRCLRPDWDRCLISLSRGGSDADVTREFDVPSKSFVEGGFYLPEAKGYVSWIDRDTVFVGTDFGPGSMTASGYPRVVKRWTRGTPLASAEVVFEGQPTDVSAYGYHDDTPGFERDFVGRGPTFYTNETYLLTRGGPVQVPKPDDAQLSAFREWLFLELRSDWEVDGLTYKAGSLLVAPFAKWMKGKREIEVLFEPTRSSSIAGTTLTNRHVVLNVLEDVRNKLFVLTPGRSGWTRVPLEGVPEFGSVSVSAVDPDESDAYWLHASDYLTPSSVALGEIGAGPAQVMKSLPSFFDASGLEVSQHFATSADGTRVPYFQVGRAGLPTDGSAPTLLYGYGGFEVSMTPGYSGGVGSNWLERGGVYVVANIRGGGEYGPSWHQAALKERRHVAYEDFVAVARDLVARGVTRPERLGAMGGSNGGLLMGNMYTTYPEDFGAIVCQVPLLDMRRYHVLLAGASWVGEYGDPDVPEEWAWLQRYSPYHNLAADRRYPPILITTSTRDDRVHPGHARKFAARLEELGKDVLYYENIEGGHGLSANNEQAAFMNALGYEFLWSRLGGPDGAGP